MNPNEAILQTAVELLAAYQPAPDRPEPNRLDVKLAPADLLLAVTRLNDAHWGYLAAITGIDPGASTGVLEVLYHFCHGPLVVTLRVRVPREAPALPSIGGVLACAGLMERELSEMLGVEISDIPYGDHLFLPDDWPAGVFPLRKEPLPASLISREAQP